MFTMASVTMQSNSPAGKSKRNRNTPCSHNVTAISGYHWQIICLK